LANTTGSPANHWIPKALANAFAGHDVFPSSVDITAMFNLSIGQAGCLMGTQFYLGLDNNHGSKIDLVTVTTHEFGHGLGFLTTTDGQTGAQLCSTFPATCFPSLWDDFLLDNTTNKNWRR